MTRAIYSVTMKDCAVARLFVFVALLLAAAPLSRATTAVAATTDLNTCHYSDLVYLSDGSLMRTSVPTHFRLMTSRYAQIVEAARGKHCTGTATIAFNGHHYLQAGMTDDPGLAQLIPNIASFSGTSLANAFDLSVFLIVLSGILIGYAGFWRMFPDAQIRWAAAALFLCLGAVELRVADVYVFQISPLIAGVPWVVHFALKRDWFALQLSAILLAFCCSWCSLVRIGTTEVCLVFLATLFIVGYGFRRALLPLILILCACVPCMLVEHHLITRRDDLLRSFGETATGVNKHPVWHSIYAGLGFVPNGEVRGFSDTAASDKVRSIDPTALYTSPQYEAILRREVIRLAIHKPFVVIENLAAKIAVVLVPVCILLFPAKLLLFSEREVRWLDAAFTAAIALSAINVILVAPKIPYMLTFLSLTFLYSSVKLGRERLSRANRVQD